MLHRIPLIARVLPLLALLPLLGCSRGASTGTDCAQFEQTFQESLDSTSSWQEKFRDYAATHPPDEEVPVVVEPNSGDIRSALETLGARGFYEFVSFSGLLFKIRTDKLPNVTEIDGIVSGSLGAQGSFTGC